jgi:hypothetical protein
LRGSDPWRCRLEEARQLHEQEAMERSGILPALLLLVCAIVIAFVVRFEKRTQDWQDAGGYSATNVNAVS